MKKRILKYSIITIIGFLISLATNQVYAKSYTITDMDIQATILEDGSIAVKQQLTYDFKGDYNGIYIDIPDSIDSEEYDKFRKQEGLKDSLYNASSVQVENVFEINGQTKQEYEKVSNASNGRKGVYILENTKDLKRIKVYCPSSNTKKTFQIDFTLKDICIKHLDIGELYYNFVGGGWETAIQNLNIDIYLPNNKTAEDLKIFAHGPYHGTANIISQNHVNLQVTDVKKGQYVAARVIFNLNNIIDAKKTSGKNALAVIMADEQKIYHNIANKEKFTNKIWILSGILFLYWIVLLLVFEKDKKYPVTQVEDEELMKKYNPLLAGCIKESRTILARDIIAVIINLISKKIVELKIIPTTKGKDGYVYELVKKEENQTPMDEIEQYVYDWFFGSEQTRSLVDRLKEMPKEKESNIRFKNLNDMAQEKLQSLGANKQMPQMVRIFNAFLLGICVVLILIHIQFNGFSIYKVDDITGGIKRFFYLLVIFLPLLMILVYIPLKILSVVRHKVNQLTKQFSGKKLVSTAIAIAVLDMAIVMITYLVVPNSYFIADEILFGIALIIVLTDNLMLKNSANMIEDFSRINQMSERLENTLMKERNIEEVMLWEQYLAYAVSFGIAKKISYKIKEIPLEDDLMRLVENKDFYGFLSSDYYMFYHYSSLDYIFLRSFHHSMGRVLSIYADTISKGSSGGGFSRRLWRRVFWRWRLLTDGGRSRWRRRCLLANEGKIR